MSTTTTTSTHSSSHRGGGRGRGGGGGGRGGGARGGGGRGDRGPESALVQLSKQLSYLLRHGAVKEGLTISSDGFVSMEDMIKHTRATEESIMECVKSNDKQRFAVQEIDGKMYIRANQGHSIAVEDLDLKKVASASEIPIVVHGTYTKFWPVIKNDGLSKMGRNHIHFASGHFTDKTVISGMRKTAEVLVYIDAEKAMKDGIEFFVSANGVILTAGNERGYLEPKYFAKAINSRGVEFDLAPSASSSSSTTTSTSSATPPSSSPLDSNAPKQKTRRSKRKPKNKMEGDSAGPVIDLTDEKEEKANR